MSKPELKTDRDLWGILNGLAYNYATVQPNPALRPDTAAAAQDIMDRRIELVDAAEHKITRLFKSRQTVVTDDATPSSTQNSKGGLDERSTLRRVLPNQDTSPVYESGK